MTPLEIIGTLVAGVGVGFVSALFGVGGAVLMIPYIVIVLQEGQHLAEGTSLIAMVPIAISGVVAHFKRGYVVFSVARRMAAGGVAGAVAGALLAHSLEAGALQHLYAAFSAVVGIGLIRGGLRDLAPPD